MPEGKLSLLVMRALFGITALTGVTLALMLLPLSLFTIILNLSPFWASILSYLLTGESISKCECFGMAVAFVGVVGVV